MTELDLFEKNRKYCATTTQLFDDFVLLTQRGGGGSRLWGQIKGQEPRRFLDFAAGIGVNALGYGDTPATRAVIKQAQTGVLHAAHNDWAVDSAILLAERLATIAPGDFPKKVFFCNSGTESTANAAKIGYAAEENRLHEAVVRAAFEIGFSSFARRTGLISFQKAFHGRLDFSREVTNSKPIHKAGYPPHMIRTFNLPFPDQGDPRYQFEAWQNRAFRLLKEWPLSTVNSFFFELIQGEGGIRFADPPAMRFLFDYVHEKRILTIDDEVQDGLDRIGALFACELFGIAPDMICLAKAIGGGIPMGLVIFRADLDPKPGQISNTFGGNPVACSASLAVLDEVQKPGLLEEVKQKGELLSNLLRDLAEELSAGGEFAVREGGMGLMRKLEFRKPNGEPQPELCKKILRRCLEHGLIVLTAGESAIRFLPPLVISDEEISFGTKIFLRAAQEVLDG